MLEVDDKLLSETLSPSRGERIGSGVGEGQAGEGTSRGSDEDEGSKGEHIRVDDVEATFSGDGAIGSVMDGGQSGDRAGQDSEGDVGSSGEQTKVDEVEATLTRDGAASINVAFAI